MLFLSSHPFCTDPFLSHEGRLRPAVVLDHIIPHRGDYDLFWAEWNWQGLCLACNDRKTALDHGRTRRESESKPPLLNSTSTATKPGGSVGSTTHPETPRGGA